MTEASRQSTLPTDANGRRRAAEAWLRRLFVVALAVFTALGLLGVFGPKGHTASADGGGYHLEVTYAAVTRPGLGAPWKVEISRVDAAALPDEITLVASAPYFDMFDANGFDPQPVSESVVDDTVHWTFSVPPGSRTLQVSFDAFVEPDAHRGRRGRTALLVDGAEAVAVNYETRVMG
jgi:hypothetical protein